MKTAPTTPPPAPDWTARRAALLEEFEACQRQLIALRDRACALQGAMAMLDELGKTPT